MTRSFSPPLTEKRAYSVPEAAKIMSIGKTKAWELVHGGQLKARKTGGRVLVLAADLDAFLLSLESVCDD